MLPILDLYSSLLQTTNRNVTASVWNPRCCLHILCCICLCGCLRLSLCFSSPVKFCNWILAESCSSRYRSPSHVDQRFRPELYYTSDKNPNNDVGLIMNLSLGLRWQPVLAWHSDKGLNAPFKNAFARLQNTPDTKKPILQASAWDQRALIHFCFILSNLVQPADQLPPVSPLPSYPLINFPRNYSSLRSATHIRWPLPSISLPFSCPFLSFFFPLPFSAHWLYDLSHLIYPPLLSSRLHLYKNSCFLLQKGLPMSSCVVIKDDMVRFRWLRYHSRSGDIIFTLPLHIPSKTVPVTIEVVMQAAE